MTPSTAYFSTPDLRSGKHASNVVVYGPPHLFRACWMAGARDYLKEPWAPEELYLRVRGPGPGIVQWDVAGGLYRLEGRRLTRESQSLVLSPAEAAVLRVLVLRRGVAVSREVLAWTAECSSGRVIDTLVGRIRKKLAQVGMPGGGPASVRGLGYRLP